jgi:hypothetical protein
MSSENFFDELWPDLPAPEPDPTEIAALPAQEPECAAVNTELDEPAPQEREPRSILDAALAWAGRGFRIFPITSGDKVPPKGLAWKIEATTDPAKIRSWWAFEPNYNYAVAAGEGVLIVDVDAAKNGFAALLDLDIPDTLTVKTPGGGVHLYLHGPDVQNSVDRIAPGIDIRSAGGYVIGPGSFFADPGGKKGYTGDYTIARHDAPAIAPEALVLRCGEPGHCDENRAPMSSDEPDDIAFAIRYLQNDAPLTKLGSGNNTTYAVAARVIEIGASPDKAFELMAEHWNPRLEEPWSDDELKRIIGNAAEYMQGRQGSRGVTAGADGFGDVVVIEPPAASAASDTAPAASLWSSGSFGRPFRLSDPIDPPEDYLYGLHYIRGIVSATAAPGGFGKSQFALGEAICMAAGRELLGEHVYEPLRVWFVSLDDPGRITRKRARAFARHHGLEDADLGDRLVLDGNDTMPPAMVKLVTASREGVKVDAATVKAFVAAIRARRVDVLILDPLIKFHAVEENDNPAMNEVGTTLAQIAIAANCAVEVLVHTSKPKGQRITAEHVRGASSFVDAARAVRVVNPMTEEEAQRLGIDEARRPWLFRVDLSKGNLAPPSEAKWFKRVSVPVNNGTARMPEGEQFPAVAPYRLPDPVATTTEADVAKALAHLARGPDQAGSPWRGSDKAHGYAGVGIAEALGLDTGDPQTRVTCRKLIKQWLSRGLLVQRSVRLRAEGREVPFIHVPADWTEKLAALRSAGGGNGGGPIAVEDPNRAGRASDFDGATTIPR